MYFVLSFYITNKQTVCKSGYKCPIYRPQSWQHIYLALFYYLRNNIIEKIDRYG